MSEEVFIKNINATPGNSYDGDILIPLIDEMVEQGFTASEVLGILLMEKLITGINCC
jgi:transposase